MPTRVLARGLRIDSNTVPPEVPLSYGTGGHRFRRVAYAIKRLDASSTSHQLTLRVQHGPDGNLWAIHTDYPALANINDLLTFESTDGVFLGEFYRPVIKTAAATGQWFLVDVFEITRAF